MKDNYSGKTLLSPNGFKTEIVKKDGKKWRCLLGSKVEYLSSNDIKSLLMLGYQLLSK